jgi:hypothetical protein
MLAGIVLVIGKPVVEVASLNMAGVGFVAVFDDEAVEFEQAEAATVTASNTGMIRQLLTAPGCLTL